MFVILCIKKSLCLDQIVRLVLKINQSQLERTNQPKHMFYQFCIFFRVSNKSNYSLRI